jgi:hypothetical protein
VTHYLDDLEVALKLLTQISNLFERLPSRQQSMLIRILSRKIVIDLEGRFVDWELNPPFEYLSGLATSAAVHGYAVSDHVQPISPAAPAAEDFAVRTHFPQRSKLQSLPHELVIGLE